MHARLLADKTQIAEEARQEITARIAALATADGRDLTDAQARLRDARTAAGSARLGTRRSRSRAVTEAQEHLDTTRPDITTRWGNAPDPGRSVMEWAAKITEEHAKSHPKVRGAKQSVSDAKEEARHIAGRHAKERTQLTVQVYGVERARQLHGTFRIFNPTADAKRARQRAAEARKIIAELDARPVIEAAEWLASRQEEQRVENETLAARRAALSPDEATATRNTDRERPGLGL